MEWKSLSCLTPCYLYSPWNSSGQNTEVVSLFLLQGIFPTQESNPGLSHCRQILYYLSHQLLLLSRFSRVRLYVTPLTASYQAPLSLGFSRQKHWSGLPCPLPGDFPNTGIKSRSLALQVDSFPSEPPGKSKNTGVGSFSGDLPDPGVSCIAGGFFTSWATRKSGPNQEEPEMPC